MIRHVVVFRWQDGVSREQIEKAAAELRGLRPLMSGVIAYHVGPDAGIVEGNEDFAVVCDFQDTGSYLAYRRHPAHVAVIEQTILPIVAERHSVQYEI
jgi:Stress responsive A/B Barrel Domain